MIILYQCEICKTQYDNKENCIICENQQKPVFNFKIGQKVTIWSSYHKQNIVRTIKSAFIWKHSAAYELDKHLHVGDRKAIGVKLNDIVEPGDSFYEGHDFLPALEEDFTIQIL